ncbi:MAG: YbaB/EbfC family nucleoid-associated protein [Alphaproteobacteria bacterium]
MDMKALMRQAQEMQNKMKQIEEEIANTEFEGSAGGGLVKAIILGNGVVKKIEIDDCLIKVEEKTVLEDLLIVAVNSAKTKADEGSSAMIKKVTAGIPLPAGFKF